MKAHRLLSLVLLLSLTGCDKFQFSIEPLSTSLPTTTAIPINAATVVAVPTEQLNPTATLEIPSPTLALPTATEVQQAPPTATVAASTEQIVKIFLIALEDNGQSGSLVGCGDSAVPVTIPQTQGVLRAALEKLLSAKKQFYGESGLYNALYQSDLQVEKVTIEQEKALIHLTGTLMLGGVCDAPRVEAQIKQTALQFSTVNEVAVFIND
ncbi:MAG TPA: GerMN domain-containing protein, partial [Anaerolineales bacterium]|nr:GerMN domain-containing protein [Anaerolineales bacterium]